MDTNALRARLALLHLERRAAESEGLMRCRAYVADLERDIEACLDALAGATVTELATARASVHGRLCG